MAIMEGVSPLINLEDDNLRKSKEIEFRDIEIKLFLLDLINVRYGTPKINKIKDIVKSV